MSSMSSSSSSFYFFSPYESHSSPSLIPTHRSSKGHRFDPYSPPSGYFSHTPETVIDNSSSSHHFSIPPPSIFRPLLPTPAAQSTPAAASYVPVYKHATKRELIRPMEDYGKFDPYRLLPEDPTLKKNRGNDDKKFFWFFVLSLLVDPSKKEAIAWTGRGREFIITSPSLLTSLWSAAQGLIKPMKFDSVRRNLRSCYKTRIVIPVDAVTNRFAFNTEPSIHVGMTRDQLTDFIATHCINDSPSINEVKDSVNVYPTPLSFNINNGSSSSSSLTSPPTVHSEMEDPVMTQFLMNSEAVHPLPILDINAFHFPSTSHFD